MIEKPLAFQAWRMREERFYHKISSKECFSRKTLYLLVNLAKFTNFSYYLAKIMSFTGKTHVGILDQGWYT